MASDYTETQVATLLAKTTFAASTAFGFDTTNAGGAATYSNPIAIAPGITKLGPGTLTLTAANTYTGATTVSAGILNAARAAPSAITLRSAWLTPRERRSTLPVSIRRLAR